MSKLATGKLRV